MKPSCKDLTKHIIEHEILGFDNTASGVVDLVIQDDAVLVASGINTINFADGISAINAGGGQVNVKLDSLQIDNNVLWVYDNTRGKWLSSYRFQAYAAEKGRARNKYLPVMDGQASNLTGYRVIRNGTITAISAQTRDVETWTLKIRKNGNPADIVSLVMSGTSGNHSSVTNVDISEGDQLHFYADTTAFLGIKDPLVWIEVAWRNDALAAP